MEKKEKKKIYTPDEVLNNFLNWFDFKKKLAFIITFVVGFITHIPMITDYIMSQDGLWNSIQYFRPGDWEVTLGRWGIVLMQRLNNFIAIPSLTTITCLIIISIVSVIVVDLFELKKKTSIIISAAIIAVCPVFLATVLYVYTAVSYCMCLLLSVLAIWCLYKVNNKKLAYGLAFTFLVLSLSIYQSYIGVSIGLCIMLEILKLINRKENVKDVLKKIANFAIIIILAGITYYVLTKIILWALVLELSNYKDANSVSIWGIIIRLKNSIIRAYKDFISFFLRDKIIFNSNYRRELFYLLFFISTGIITLKKMFENKYERKREKALNIIVIILLVCILPLALNVVDLLVESDIYVLTAFQMIFIIPFCLALIENDDKSKYLKWVSVISIFLVIGTYYIADNTSYTALKLTYNQAYSTTERLIDRIENMPEYDKNCQIVFGGIVGNNNFPRTSNIYQYTIGTIVNNTTFHGTYGGQIGTWVNYLKIFFGLDVVPCDANLYYTIIQSEEYKDMEIFPAQNSIKIRDGLIIVKLSDDPPLPF